MSDTAPTTHAAVRPPTGRPRRAVRSAALAGSALLVTLGVALAPGAGAIAGDDRVERSGSCSGPGAARWDLKVKTDDGGLEVEGEVDSNRSGQTWRWVIRRNGERVAGGVATTTGPSGSFSVERRTSDAAGPDRIVFRATRGDSGQVCRGSLTF